MFDACFRKSGWFAVITQLVISNSVFTSFQIKYYKKSLIRFITYEVSPRIASLHVQWMLHCWPLRVVAVWD